MLTFYGSEASQPDGMSLKAQLAWSYFFENGWAVTRTEDGVYIVTDEACDLSTAGIYPDEEALIAWLEEATEENLNDDPEDYLRTFVSIRGLLSTDVVAAMIELVCGSAAASTPHPSDPPPTTQTEKKNDAENKIDGEEAEAESR